MTQEFVTYKQAQDLKELGYDKQCFMYYQIDTDTKELQKPMDNEYWGYYSDPRNWNSFDFLPYKPFCKCMSAPLKSQFFRWAREKNYKFSIVSDSGVDTEGLYFFDIWHNGYFLWETEFKYTTYEEAEDALINKLIEILFKEKDDMVSADIVGY